CETGTIQSVIKQNFWDSPMPPLYFCSRLVSGITIFKSAGNVCITALLRLGSTPSIFKKHFRTDRDVRGSTQLRRFCLAKTRVQKLTRRSIFELATDGGGSTQ
ncbi:hypothetical protein, partial [Treponema sp.]|uniref:hypothetical protein n=1 Tax=Treponema sp. TaxID=166 RepID=UPI003FA33F14